MNRLGWWVALAGCLAACTSIADKHVGEGQAGGGGSRGGTSSSASASGSHSVGGRPTVVPILPNESDGSAGENGSAGAVIGHGGSPGGEVLELGGAPADCVETNVASGGSPDNVRACFRSVSAGKRCEQAEAHAQGQYLERACGVTSVDECQAACLERADCTGVSDYFAAQGLDLCYLRHVPCGSVSNDSGYEEEDGGKEYVKVCPPGQPCHFEHLGDWNRCADHGGESITTLTTSLRDCVDLCLDDPTCVSVVDYFYLSRVPGCHLYTGTCDAPAPLPYGDTGRAFVRVACD